MIKGETTLPWWAYLTALVLGGVVTPFSTLLYARMGNGIATNQLMKMVAGAINPGRPVANLYVRSEYVRSIHMCADVAFSFPCGATTWSRLRSTSRET